MLSCVGTLALFVSAVTPISTVTAPVAEAAPQTRQLIIPIGYKMVNGKQDRENPLSAPDLLVDPGYSETRPNFGDQENNEDVIGTDDRYEVKDATQYPYRWVGTLTFTLESGKRVSCTGSLIGPDSVVTSGHCLSDKFTDMTFSPGQNGDSKPFGTANVTQVWMDENKRSEQDIERDWAVAKLDQPLGNKAGWFGMKSADNESLYGKSTTIIGYPVDKEKNTMWVGHGRIFSEERGLFYHDTDTYYGNSGSSVLDERGTIYGIHYGGNAQSAVSTRITHNIFNVLANITNRSTEDLAQSR